MTQILSQSQVNVILEIVTMDIVSFYDTDSEPESGKCYIRNSYDGYWKLLRQVNVILEIVTMDIGSFHDTDSEPETGKCFIRNSYDGYRIHPSQYFDHIGSCCRITVSIFQSPLNAFSLIRISKKLFWRFC